MLIQLFSFCSVEKCEKSNKHWKIVKKYETIHGIIEWKFKNPRFLTILGKRVKQPEKDEENWEEKTIKSENWLKDRKNVILNRKKKLGKSEKN